MRGLVTVLLPALDEEETVGEVIEKIPYKELKEKGYETEVIVVDGHSSDNTREVAKQKGAKVIVQHGRGKGLAMRDGIKAAEGEYLFVMDADDTYSTKYIVKMLEALKERKYDVMLGSRLCGYIMNGAMTWLNYLGNHILTIMANLLFPNEYKISDVCTGMWGARKEVVEELKLSSTGFEIEAEMFAKCIKKRFSMGEIPIEYWKRETPPKLRSIYDGMRIGWKLIMERTF